MEKPTTDVNMSYLVFLLLLLWLAHVVSLCEFCHWTCVELEGLQQGRGQAAAAGAAAASQT